MILNWLRRSTTEPVPDGAGWYAAPASALRDLIDAERSRSVYCIANSDDVPTAEVLARLGPSDLLIQYNTCPYAAAFAAAPCPSILVFHMTERAGVVHGFSRDGRPTVDLTLFGAGSRACFLRGERADPGMPPPIDLPAFVLESQRLQELFYRSPAQVIPSAGFASALLFHLINVLRGLDDRPPHRIALCGFTGRYQGTAFPGHDFHFEQTELARLPNITRVGQETPVAQAPSRLHHDLADVFHPDYDGHRRGKAEMLFDIAKLHLAAGDIESFVDFVRSSAGLNPGFRQGQWLLRALDALRDGGAPLDAERADGLQALIGGVDDLRLRWASGNAPGLGGAAFPSDFEHPQAAYVVEEGTWPRVLIVNETSKLPFNRWHLGCDLVSRTLVDRLAAHGLACAGLANGVGGLNRILAHDPAARFEAVVINGEGTLHDDADRAFEIVSMGRYLKGIGKKVFLINTVWEANGPRLSEMLADFDLIAVRESRSADNLRRLRDVVRIVPDLCWYANLPAPARVAAPVSILDCVDPDTTAVLRGLTGRAGLPLFVMDRFFAAFHRAVRAGCPPSLAPRVLRAEDVGAAGTWIGGRFHGAVLALGAGVPILCVPSNTGKIEAMLGDIGLEDKMLRPHTLDALRHLDDVSGLLAEHAFSRQDWRKVEDYRCRARSEVDRLFADIADAAT